MLMMVVQFVIINSFVKVFIQENKNLPCLQALLSGWSCLSSFLSLLFISPGLFFISWQRSFVFNMDSVFFDFVNRILVATLCFQTWKEMISSLLFISDELVQVTKKFYWSRLIPLLTCSNIGRRQFRCR